jgi:predicted ATPase
MFTEIRLTNFKCFREETVFPISKINLLTGINGRGKSTLLQSLLLIKQSAEHNEYTNRVVLNGNCVNLGSFEDIKHWQNSVSEDVVFDFLFFNKKIHFSFKQNDLQGRNLLIADIDDQDLGFENMQESLKKMGYSIEESFHETQKIINNDPSKEAMFLEMGKNMARNHTLSIFTKIHYIAADRIGAQEYFEISNLSKFISVDKKGENAATVLLEFKEQLIDEKLYLGEDAKNLETQTGEWLSKIFDTKVEIGGLEESSPFVVPLIFKIEGKVCKPTNVGFGYSYILPIVVSGLIAQKSEILIIENPEAHLHPKAQSELTKFLAKVASCGVQVFIESHSEHILNGLRIAALEPDIELDTEDVNILYFQNDDKKPFVKLPVEKDGKIKNWVDGFFDQQEQDLAKIFKLGRGKR